MDLVERAKNGDADALDSLIASVQDKIYGLAVRMLWHPEDAQDATQEILIRIVTHLSTYRGESAFTTWCYAVATNYLRTAAKSRLERHDYTFDRFGDELLDSAAEPADDLRERPDYLSLLEEIKVGCTLGMLLCLDREHRLVYILGEILEIDSTEGANILNISAAAFRKRLSRSRERIISFTSRMCGLLDKGNRCHCRLRLTAAMASGRVAAGHSIFPVADTAADFARVEREVQKLESARRMAAIYRSHPPFVAGDALRDRLRQLVRGLA
ncbi:MAG: RNA polymerase subunit sigma-24 [Acidobacteria bacterium]|nr:MAG: RNA polymerase subunit sigma-24 [Acidobacteriota bacterium]